MKKEKDQPELTADKLRETLWEAIQGLRAGRLSTEDVNSLAMASREIMKSVKEERIISMLTQEPPSGGFLDFYGLKEKKAIRASGSEYPLLPKPDENR